jgi:hypothetical protein
MTTRIFCCVPFCRRSRPGNEAKEEWICPRHFQPVDRRLHRLYNAAHSRATKVEAMPGPEDAPEKVRAYRLVTWLWHRCRRQAIERAAGIA